MKSDRKTAKLKDIVEYTKDGEWGKNENNKSLIKAKVIRGADFEQVKICNVENLPIRYIKEDIVKRKKLLPFDIVIETAGGTRGRPTGRTIIIKPNLFCKSNTPYICASFCRFLRVNKNIINPSFLYWYLQYLYKKGMMEIYQVQHTGIARFQYTVFSKSINIPLKLMQIQKKIAKILSDLDDKIEVNEKINKKLEEMAQAVFKHWFIDFEYPVILDYECEIDEEHKSELMKYGYKSFGGLPAPEKGKIFVYVLKNIDDSYITGTTDFLLKEYNKLKKENPGIEKFIYWEKFDSENEVKEKEEYLRTEEGKNWLKEELKTNSKSQKGKMKESKLGKIPEKWEVCKIDKLCKVIQNGGTPSRKKSDYWTNGKLRWLSSKEIREKIVLDTLEKINKLGYENSSAKMWPKYTTVVALYGATAGEVSLLGNEMCSNQACCGLVPKEHYTFYNYIYFILNKNKLKRYARGSAQQNLSQDIIRNFLIFYPCKEILNIFNKFVYSLFEKMIINLKENENLSKIRDTLLPKLMSGELSVENLDIDISEGEK